MSLETVVEDIRDEARARAEEIRDEGEQRAEEIVSQAEQESTEIREQAELEAEREIEQEREQRLSSAKLEAKQARLDARRSVLQDVRSQVEAEIAGLEGEEREELTETLLAAAAEEFEDPSGVQVYGRDEDGELLESLVAEYEGFEYAGEYDCLGGVVVQSEESRIRVNNTFDTILEGVWEEHLRDISERLFEQ